MVVAQNAGATRLYHNVAGKAGLRVQLRGPAGNPDAIGAVLRPVRHGQLGPAQAITAGGGYGSQAATVMIVPGDSEAVEVRWPGGKVSRTATPSSATAMSVTHP